MVFQRGLGADKAAYAYFRPMQILIQQFNEMGTERRQKFFIKEGKIDWLKLAKFTARLVKSHVYSRKEFFAYAGWNKDEKDTEKNPIKTKIQRDWEEAKAFQKQFEKMYNLQFNEPKDRQEKALVNLWHQLRFLKDKAQIWKLLLPKDEEKKQYFADCGFHELFWKHNSLPPAPRELYAHKIGYGRSF